MTKWDTFTVLLKDHKLDEFLKKLEKRAQGEPIKMKQIILDSAHEWILSKPLQGKKIIAKIIEVITIDNAMKKWDLK